MAGNPNPSFTLNPINTGLAPAPQGGGNTPLIIGWTSQGQYSGSPGIGLYSLAGQPANVTAALGSYGNAVDSACFQMSRGASSVVVYKAFSGSIGASAYATLTVPSTTGGDGILLTANEEGTAGNSITFHLIISGGGSSAVLSGTSTAIVLTCGSTCTNNTAIAAITGTAVTATLISGGTDDVVAFALANLTGGAGGHTGTGTGEITQSGQPTAPFGSGQNGSGILVQIDTSSTSGTYGTFSVSLDGGNTFGAPQATPASAGTYLVPGTGVTLTFTGAEASGVWVAGDTYSNPITTAVGKMYPYGGSFSILQTTATGSTSVLGEGTFANNSGNPLDNFQVLIVITKTGTLAAGTAQYIYSFDGGITFSSTQTLNSASVNLPAGVLLTASDTGGSGSTDVGFVAGERYSFSTQGPQLTTTDITNILANLQAASTGATSWGWVHIAQQCNTVNTSATGGGFELDSLFTVLSNAGTSWFTANQYVGSYFLCDTPPDDPLRAGGVNIDSTLETWAAGVASDYVSVGLGNAAPTASPANGWQLPRGSSWDLSGRYCTTPLGTDAAWVATGPIGGIGSLYRNEAQTPGLGPAGFVPLWTFNQLTGSYITNPNILCSSESDISLGQYRRVLNAACAASYKALVQNLSGYVRTAGGLIDPRDVVNIDKQCQAAALQAVSGQCQTVICNLSPVIGAGGAITMETGILPFQYIKAITENIGFISPSLAAAAS